MFVVERRMPNVTRADLAMLQEALRFVCDRLTPVVSRRPAVVRRPVPASRLLTLFEAESAEVVRRANENVDAWQIAGVRPPSPRGDASLREGQRSEHEIPPGAITKWLASSHIDFELSQLSEVDLVAKASPSVPANSRPHRYQAR